jgi:hypothetical protein
MTHQHIDELLADPIIQMVMKADNVEPLALKGLMSRVASGRPARALAFKPENVRFAGQMRPLRLSPPSTYKNDETCLYC